MFSAEPVCSCAFSFVHFAHETAGAARTRLSLRPLFSKGETISEKLARNARRGREAMFSVIARSDLSAVAQRAKAEATKQSMLALRPNGLLRGACHRAALRADPLARNDGPKSAVALLRGLRGLAEHPRRRRKTARRAVSDLDLIFPGQAEGAGDHVLHESVGAIHRAALYRAIITQNLGKIGGISSCECSGAPSGAPQALCGRLRPRSGEGVPGGPKPGALRAAIATMSEHLP
jgi:hypothetical protein